MATVKTSGYMYIPARRRNPQSDKECNLERIRIASKRNCKHTETVCATPECVESWEKDWKLFFPRTAGGRSLAWNIGRDISDMDRSIKLVGE